MTLLIGTQSLVLCISTARHKIEVRSPCLSHTLSTVCQLWQFFMDPDPGTMGQVHNANQTTPYLMVKPVGAIEAEFLSASERTQWLARALEQKQSSGNLPGLANRA